MREVRFPACDGTPLSGIVAFPEGEGPFPGLIALHGCSGLWTESHRLKSREADWAKRLTGAGYAVFFPDSFSARGVRSICSKVDRPILPERERVRDAYDALLWFQGQPEVRADRVALLGWSHGAMTTLWAMATQSPGRPDGLSQDFVGAVAFYPGCAQIGRERPNYAAAAPMLWQLGAEDDWTPAAPCVKLASRSGSGAKIEIDVYPSAHHGFEQPIGTVHEVLVKNAIYKTGEKVVHVGANPDARARAVERVMTWLDDVLRSGSEKGRE